MKLCSAVLFVQQVGSVHTVGHVMKLMLRNYELLQKKI